MVTEEFRESRKHLLEEANRRRRIKPINPDHWHYKLYLAWLKEKRPRTEPQLNFCHYWRVVLIFALPSLLWRRCSTSSACCRSAG